MAFPWLSFEGFELGTRGTFDATSDASSKITFPQYATLAGIPGAPAPYRGAYAMMVNLAPATTTAYVQETGAWDTAQAGTIWFRYQFWIGGSPTMANNDEFSIFQLWSGASTVEAAVVINYTTANGYRIGVGETGGSQYLPFSLNAWHTVEVGAVIDSGANNGTLDLYLDGAAATQITGLTQAAITSGVLGVIGQDSGTTRGLVLFDDVLADDAQIYQNVQRFPITFPVTASQHVFVGPGHIDTAALLSTGASDTMILYDTDAANANDAQSFVVELNNAIHSAAEGPYSFLRGCYAVLSGTNPRGTVTLTQHNSQHDAHGPVAYGGDGAIRTYGAKRVARAQNV